MRILHMRYPGSLDIDTSTRASPISPTGSLEVRSLPVSVVVVNYNGKEFLSDCLGSLRALSPAAREVILVDNGSTDGSADWVREYHPWVTVLDTGENLGYCGGNNRGIEASRTPFVALLNNDTRVEPDWLGFLYNALEGDPSAAACSSLVLLPPEKEPIVHYAGSEAHFLGHIANTHYLKRLSAVHNGLDSQEVGVYVGSSVLLRRSALDEVGLLEERMFIYEDELDMCLRFRSHGWRILFEPKSVVWHFSGTPDLAVRERQRYPTRRAFLVTRNRWMLLLRNYELKTLILLSPVLIFFELAWMMAMVLSRNGGSYLRGMLWNWQERRWVSQERLRIQDSRTIPDIDLLSARPLTPVPGLMGSPILLAIRRAGEFVLKLYWQAVKRLLGIRRGGRRPI